MQRVPAVMDFNILVDMGRMDPRWPSAARTWLFAGSDRGGERAAAIYSLIVTAKLNQIDPRAWLADVLARIADHPASRLHELLPWHWPRPTEDRSLAA